MSTGLIIFLILLGVFELLHIIFSVVLMLALGAVSRQQASYAKVYRDSLINMATAADTQIGMTNTAVRNIASFLVDTFGLRDVLKDEKKLEATTLQGYVPPSGSLKN